MKRILVLFVVGALVGVLLAAWIGPRLLGWWFSPPVPNALITCNESVAWAMTSLVRAQLAAAVVTGVLVNVVGVFVSRALAARAARKAAAAAAGIPPKA